MFPLCETYELLPHTLNNGHCIRRTCSTGDHQAVTEARSPVVVVAEKGIDPSQDAWRSVH